MHQGPPPGYRGGGSHSNQGYAMAHSYGRHPANEGFGRPSPRPHMPQSHSHPHMNVGQSPRGPGPGVRTASPRADMGPGGPSPRNHRSGDITDDLPRLPPIMQQLFVEEDQIQEELRKLYQARAQLAKGVVTSKAKQHCSQPCLLTMSLQLNTDHAKALEALAKQQAQLVSQQLRESEVRMSEAMG